MTKAKSKGEKDAVQRQETLNSKIRMDGVGEDPAIQAITSKEFLTANDVEAAKMAAGIAKILRGDLTAEFDERLNKYLELVSKQMEEERKYNEGRIKWLEENRHLLGDNFDAAYFKRFGFGTLGGGEKDIYETMVFKAEKSNNKCCPYRIISWENVESKRYETDGEAVKGHSKLCKKWSKK